MSGYSDSKRTEIPRSRFFDLRPGDEGNSAMQSIKAAALFSRQPAANTVEQLELAYEHIEYTAFSVEQTPYNAAGGYTYLPGESPPDHPPPEPDPDAFFDPGLPPPVVAIPMNIGDFSFPLVVDQSGSLNMNKGDGGIIFQ